MNVAALSLRDRELRPRIGVLMLAAALSTWGSASWADDEPTEAPAEKKDRMTELLDKLKDKGVIDSDEYDELAGNTPEARAEARAERRKQALKKAQDEEKEAVRKAQYGLRWNNGLVFETPDRASNVSLSGRIHADYRNYSGDTAASTFDIRRAYLTLAGKWNEWITWDITGDFAQTTTSATNTQSNGGSHLDVAWFNMAPSEAFQVRFGQFKMPMVMEELGSSRFIDFQERSMVDRLAPAKERGAMVHGVPTRGFTYAVALSNGGGKNINETNAAVDRPDLIGRATINIAEMIGAQASSIYHFGISGSTGTLATGTVLGTQATEARGATFFSLTNSTGSPVSRDRTAFEFAFARGPVKLQAESINVSYSGAIANGTGYDKSIEAHYVSLLWLVTGERYAEAYRNGAFGRVVPFTNFVPGGSGTGAFELGLRYSRLNGNDFLQGVGPTITSAAFASGAETWTLQGKWIVNPNLKFYVDYIDTRFTRPITISSIVHSHERAVTMRAAFDF